MTPNDISRRNALKASGAAIAGSTLPTTASAVPVSGGSTDSDFGIYLTKRTDALHSDDGLARTIATTFGDALEHVDVSWTSLDLGGVVPVSGEIVTITDLYDQFYNYLEANGPTSAHSNLLIARESRVQGRPFLGEYEGNVSVAAGAQSIATDISGTADRYGTSVGDEWLNVAFKAAGYNLGVVEGHGRVYSDTSVADGPIASPSALPDHERNICGASSIVTETIDTYDHYFDYDCSGAVIRSYYG